MKGGARIWVGSGSNFRPWHEGFSSRGTRVAPRYWMRSTVSFLVMAGLFIACATLDENDGFSQQPGAIPAAERLETLSDVAQVRRIGDEWQIVLRGADYFETGNARPVPQSLPKLMRIADALASLGTADIKIEGHTDDVGSPLENQLLSEQRALAIQQYLVRRNVPPETMIVVGHGERDPIDTNLTERGRSNNRRVVIHVRTGEPDLFE